MFAQGAVEAGETTNDRVSAQGEVVEERKALVAEAATAHRQAATTLREENGAWAEYKANADAMNAADRAWVMRPDATGPYLDAIATAKTRVEKRLEAWETARDKLAEAREKKAEIALETNPARSILTGAATMLGYEESEVGRFNLAIGISIAILMELLRIAAAALLNTSLRHSLAWMRERQDVENTRAYEKEIDRQELEDAREAPERVKRKVEIATARARADNLMEWGEARASEIGKAVREDARDLDERLQIPTPPSPELELPGTGHSAEVAAPAEEPAAHPAPQHSETPDTVPECVPEHPCLETLTPKKRQRVQTAMGNIKAGSRPDALTASALREWGDLYGDDERRVFCDWLAERGMAEAPVARGQGYAWKAAA